jgi:predicted Ser/Thr protein kinase
MFELDEIKYNKLEMNHPHKHILINEKTLAVKLIDFERCKRVDTPKNVTQFCTFLTSTEISDILKSKKININEETFRKKATNYKRSYSQVSFDKIKAELK